MVAIRHDDVIDGAVAEDHRTGFTCHRRRIDKNLVFPDRQEEPVKIDLLLLREPGPLPDAGKDLFHDTRARGASVARRAGRGGWISSNCFLTPRLSLLSPSSLRLTTRRRHL